MDQGRTLAHTLAGKALAELAGNRGMIEERNLQIYADDISSAGLHIVYFDDGQLLQLGIQRRSPQAESCSRAIFAGDAAPGRAHCVHDVLPFGNCMGCMLR